MTQDEGLMGGAAAGWLLETEQLAHRQRREPLSRPEIVAAALRIIDTDGLEALSMRRLGVELGVRAMAMYRHVRDKNQLLDLVIEGVLRDIEITEPGGEWRSEAAAIARAMRHGLMRHRHAITLLASRPWVGPTGLAGVDRTLGAFRRSGASDRTVVYAQFALGNFVTGFCAWEAANMGASSEDPEARARALAGYQAFVAGLPADRFPNLTALGPMLIAGPLDERFEAGLEFLLDGIAARVTAEADATGPADASMQGLIAGDESVRGAGGRTPPPWPARAPPRPPPHGRRGRGRTRERRRPRPPSSEDGPA